MQFFSQALVNVIKIILVKFYPKNKEKRRQKIDENVQTVEKLHLKKRYLGIALLICTVPYYW